MNHPSEILPVLESNLAVDAYRERRNQIFHYSIFQPDGHATERQANAIMALYNKYRHLPYWQFALRMAYKQNMKRFWVKFIGKRRFKRL